MWVAVALFGLVAAVSADHPKNQAFTNEPIEIPAYYHERNEYENRPWDFWYEHRPMPHKHGNMRPDALHQHYHYPPYPEVTDFVTDPPGQGLNTAATLAPQTSYDEFTALGGGSPSFPPGSHPDAGHGGRVPGRGADHHGRVPGSGHNRDRDHGEGDHGDGDHGRGGHFGEEFGRNGGQPGHSGSDSRSGERDSHSGHGGRSGNAPGNGRGPFGPRGNKNHDPLNSGEDSGEYDKTLGAKKGGRGPHGSKYPQGTGENGDKPEGTVGSGSQRGRNGNHPEYENPKAVGLGAGTGPSAVRTPGGPRGPTGSEKYSYDNNGGGPPSDSSDYLDLPPGVQPDALPHLPKLEASSNPYKQPDDDDENDYLEETPAPTNPTHPGETHPASTKITSGGYEHEDKHGSTENSKIGEFFPDEEKENGGNGGGKSQNGKKDKYTDEHEEDKDKYPESVSTLKPPTSTKKCCGCCKDDKTSPKTSIRPNTPSGHSRIHPVPETDVELVGEADIPAPGQGQVVGFVPAYPGGLPSSPCCRPAPFPCCPTLPNCCIPPPPPLPTIPCCPRPPPPPCCPSLPSICCQPVQPCCVALPPPPVCCPLPQIPVCYRACPACPCRRRVSMVKRLKRQAGVAGSCSACSAGGQPALGAYQQPVPQSGCRQCAGRKKRQAQNDFLSALSANTNSLLSGLHSSGQSSCGTCRGGAKRVKRFGCVPCLGRKKREMDEENEHKRAKRLGCIPCLKRAKKSVPQGGCHSCNNLGQVLSRFKRSFSCTICHTAKQRAKRAVEVEQYMNATITDGIRRYPQNCQRCGAVPEFRSPPLPSAHRRAKRQDHFSKHKNDGEAHVNADDNDDFHDLPSGFERVKPKSKAKYADEAEDSSSSAGSYDSLFDCDHSCCDYSKCVKVKSRPINLDFMK